MKKARYGSEEDARLAAQRSGLTLLPYRCDRCRNFTSPVERGPKGCVAQSVKADVASPSGLKRQLPPSREMVQNDAARGRHVE
jgi:hypothetical protein